MVWSAHEPSPVPIRVDDVATASAEGATGGRNQRFVAETIIFGPEIHTPEESKMGNKKYFVLQEGGQDTNHVFASKQPRGAALKAASRGHTDIRLRERGTKRVHVFNGWRQEVDKPANGPAWLPDRIVKSNVKKIGIEHLD